MSLSIARSRLALVAQLVYFGLNGFGLLVITIYNSKTPDLYENNLHHSFGWALTWIMLGQILIGLARFYRNGSASEEGSHEERACFMPVSTDRMVAYQQMHPNSMPSIYRYSHDSGQGTEIGSTRSNSIAGLQEEKDEQPQEFQDHSEDDGPTQPSPRRFLKPNRLDSALLYIATAVPKRTMNVMCFMYNAVDCLILVLGFVAVITGLVTYGGVFVSRNCFLGAVQMLTFASVDATFSMV